MFSTFSLKADSREPSLAKSATRPRGFEGVEPYVREALRAGGAPLDPPEQLLSALLLQVLYSVRSERQLMEQLDYNLLFRWFVGLSPDDPIWDPTVFTKNRNAFKKAMCSRSS